MGYALWGFVAVYLAVGLTFIIRSENRGIVADALFAALWPVYLWQHFRGRW